MATLIVFLGVLLVVVVVHESGHFFVARRLHIHVEEFGFGFPPRIVGKKRKGTVYSINWLPFGGFVKIKGEDGGSENDEDSFSSRPVWNRAVVISAGVVMNLLLAAVLLSIGFMIGLPSAIDAQTAAGATIQKPRVQIVEIRQGTPAGAADVQEGDIIRTLDGIEIQTIEEVQAYTRQREGIPIDVGLQHIDEQKTVRITPQVIEGSSVPVFGVGLLETAIVSYPWYTSIVFGFQSTIALAWAIIMGFAMLIRDLFTGGGIPSSVSGPVGIAVLSGQFARLGIAHLLQFTAILSINLAIINAVPFPALDGGRLLFLGIEKLRGKKVDQRIEGLTHSIGFIVLLLILFAVTFRDVQSYTAPLKQFISKIFSIR